MLAVHRAKDTWDARVTRYIALTQFARDKFAAAGLPAAKLVVKPNVVYPTPTPGESTGEFALFAGRLSPEKGIATMLEAWQQIGTRLPLQIVGGGPLAPQVQEVCQRTPGLTYRGRLPRAEVIALMQAAKVMIFPSVWYEMFSMTAIESLSVATPVIASNLGSMTELIRHQHNGLHFRPGAAGELVAQVNWALEHPVELQQMGRQARADFEEHYTAERNYELLMNIYRQAIAERQGLP
jgi:glycosyltransferase involved in cell wall biosynthesis